MSKDFFTSDHHFGHANIIKYQDRPFESVKEMDDFMIARWNETVGPDDRVYYLGDFAITDDWRKRELRCLLNGYIIFVPGNHDIWPKDLYRGLTLEEIKAVAKMQYLDLGFDEVHWEGEIQYKGWTLYHHPVKTKGQYLTGHVHGAWEVEDGRPHGSLCINVGVEVNDYRPQTLEQLRRKL